MPLCFPVFLIQADASWEDTTYTSKSQEIYNSSSFNETVNDMSDNINATTTDDSSYLTNTYSLSEGLLKSIQESLVDGKYPTNQFGETFGICGAEYVVGVEPDLTAVIGDNGKSGYIYTSLLNGSKCFKNAPVYDLNGNIIDTFSATPFGYEDDCGHYPPKGFTYITKGTGNTFKDAKVSLTALGILLKFTGLSIPAPASIIIKKELVTPLGERKLKDGTVVSGDYRYTEYWKDPCTWRHYTYKVYDDDGQLLALPCCAVNSCKPGEVE